MSSNTLLRVLALLAALLVVWGAVALFRGGLSDAPAGLDLPHLTAADVDRYRRELADGQSVVVVAAGGTVVVLGGTATIGLAFLALLGGIAARVGGANSLVGAARVTFWGALAMALTAAIGALFGTVV